MNADHVILDKEPLRMNADHVILDLKGRKSDRRRWAFLKPRLFETKRAQTVQIMHLVQVNKAYC